MLGVEAALRPVRGLAECWGGLAWVVEVVVEEGQVNTVLELATTTAPAPPTVLTTVLCSALLPVNSSGS